MVKARATINTAVYMGWRMYLYGPPVTRLPFGATSGMTLKVVVLRMVQKAYIPMARPMESNAWSKNVDGSSGPVNAKYTMATA